MSAIQILQVHPPHLWCWRQPLLFDQVGPPAWRGPSSHSPAKNQRNRQIRFELAESIEYLGMVNENGKMEKYILIQIHNFQCEIHPTCKRKDRLLSEPSTMALLTCKFSRELRGYLWDIFGIPGGCKCVGTLRPTTHMDLCFVGLRYKDKHYLLD